MENEKGKSDARLLDAVWKHEKAVMKSLETCIASCEAITGIRAEDRKVVRKFVSDLRAIRELGAISTTPTPPSQTSRLPKWATGWTAIGCGAGVLGLLAWLVLG
jgi:hypothetical protein